MTRTSAPVAFIGGMSRAAHENIVVKSGGTLEQLAQITSVAFDKTGTLTYGRPEVDHVEASAAFSESDIVRYADGSEARIISGAGVASVYAGRPIALVGSELDNGDRITGPIHNGMVIVQYADEAPIKGLLDPSYVPPQSDGEKQHG